MNEASGPSSAIAFPALCVPRDFGVYIVRSPRELQTSRARLVWAFPHFERMRIYDSSGRAYEVTSTRVVRPRSRLGRAVARILDLGVQLEIAVTPLGEASLRDVVSAVEKAIALDPESFEELSGRDVTWWRATLDRAASISDVIRAFGEV